MLVTALDNYSTSEQMVERLGEAPARQYQMLTRMVVAILAGSRLNRQDSQVYFRRSGFGETSSPEASELFQKQLEGLLSSPDMPWQAQEHIKPGEGPSRNGFLSNLAERV